MSVISVAEVEQATGVLRIGAQDILTPLARDRAKELGVAIERAETQGAAPARPVPQPTRVAVSRAAAQGAGLLFRAPPRVDGGEPFPGTLYRRGAAVPQRLLPQAAAPAQTAGADARPRAAVVGAGHVGAMTAMRLAESSLFSVVRLIDIVPGLAEGLALDMWHSAALRGFTSRVTGSADVNAVAGVDFIVVTAGRPRQPGMSRTDLTGVNAEIVGGVADAIRAHAPQAVVVVVTNPLEEMTHLLAARTGFPHQRVIGMAGVLDTTRFCSLVGLTGVARPQDVHAYAFGSHGPEMVIPLSQAKVGERRLEDMLDQATLSAIIERARDSGAEVVKLLQKGSAYFSPADSAAAMVIAMAADRNEVMAACVQSGGAYGTVDTRVGLPVRLGRRGVAEVVALELRADELAALRKSAASIAERIKQLG
jgi:malate dehydrogenase